jgi:transcriptional regulator with XRE-family HTH domain
MAENDEKTLFQKLKKIRLDKNISLKTISRDSRIQIAYLEAIEAGELDKIPAVYDKLFFQTYISYLNLENSEDYVNEYRALRKETFQPSPSTTIRKITSSQEKQHPFFNLRILFIVVPALVIIILIGFMAWNTESIGTNPDEKVKELPVRQIVQEINDDEIENAKTIASRNGITDGVKKVKVNLEAVERTWLRYIKDTKDTSEFMLAPGNKISVDADSTLHFLIGKAHGIKFTINGENKGILGRQGEVISYLKITKNGIEGQRNKNVALAE